MQEEKASPHLSEKQEQVDFIFISNSLILYYKALMEAS